VAPNFWCSEEYFINANFQERELNGALGVFEFDEGLLVFPPLDIDGRLQWPKGFPDRVWSDFAGFSWAGAESEFLDFEFLYDPQRFLNMIGGSWMVFRKNSRKFPARLGQALTYRRLTEGEMEGALTELLIGWLEEKGEEAEIHDGDLMLDFALHGENRKALFDDAGQLWGVNVWDENYQYVNYRYCLCAKEPFLGEYMRLIFYTDEEILTKGKLINDGGALDSEPLRVFKEKLNPIRVREVCGWRKK